MQLKNNYKIFELFFKDNYGYEGVISFLIFNMNNKVIIVDEFIMKYRLFGDI